MIVRLGSADRRYEDPRSTACVGALTDDNVLPLWSLGRLAGDGAGQGSNPATFGLRVRGARRLRSDRAAINARVRIVGTTPRRSSRAVGELWRRQHHRDYPAGLPDMNELALLGNVVNRTHELTLTEAVQKRLA